MGRGAKVTAFDEVWHRWLSTLARLLRQLHVLGLHVIRGGEIAPRQRAFLAVGLAERQRQACPRELLPEVERVARIVDLEPLEDRLDVGPADEQLVVEDGD